MNGQKPVSKIPKLVVIVGETASGKSGLAMEIARKFDGEIINADSWAIYKGFDIGTAKPTPQEQAEIPHHLLDIAKPTDDFSAAIYKHLAIEATIEIASRGKLPILAGGTGLYIDGVIFDYSFLPAGKAGKRAQLAGLTIKELLAQINQQGLDMTGIDPRNKRRLIRLIETGGAKPQRSDSIRSNTLVLGVKIPRTKLRQRIEKRTETMLRTGLKREVRQLAAEYGWENEAMKGIGYREFKDYFAGSISNSQLKNKIVKSTIELAKRQRTWFKRNPNIHWIEDSAQAMKLVSDFIHK